MGVSGAGTQNLGSTRFALRRSCGLGVRSMREDILRERGKRKAPLAVVGKGGPLTWSES